MKRKLKWKITGGLFKLCIGIAMLAGQHCYGQVTATNKGNWVFVPQMVLYSSGNKDIMLKTVDSLAYEKGQNIKSAAIHFSIAPGYFVQKDLLAGIRIGAGGNNTKDLTVSDSVLIKTSSSSFSAGPYIKKFFTLNDKTFNPSISFSPELGLTRYNYTADMKGVLKDRVIQHGSFWGASIEAGMSQFSAKNHLSLDFAVGYNFRKELSDVTYSLSPEYYTVATTQNRVSIHIGFTYYIGKN